MTEFDADELGVSTFEGAQPSAQMAAPSFETPPLYAVVYNTGGYASPFDTSSVRVLMRTFDGTEKPTTRDDLDALRSGPERAYVRDPDSVTALVNYSRFDREVRSSASALKGLADHTRDAYLQFPHTHPYLMYLARNIEESARSASKIEINQTEHDTLRSRADAEREVLIDKAQQTSRASGVEAQLVEVLKNKTQTIVKDTVKWTASEIGKTALTYLGTWLFGRSLNVGRKALAASVD